MPTEDQVEVGAVALKRFADDTSYGWYFTLDRCREVARLVLEAVERDDDA